MPPPRPPRRRHLAAFLASLGALAACGATPASDAIGWSCEVELRQGGNELALAARYPPGDELELTVAPLAREFVRDVEAEVDGRRLALSGDDGWRLPASRGERHVSWRFAARDAARALDRSQLAAARGEGIVGSLAAFLLRDDDEPVTNFRLTTQPAAGATFTCALERVDPTVATAWLGSTGDLAAGPRCAFGPIRARSLAVDGFTIELVELESRSEEASAALVAWSSDAARAILEGFGRPPLPRLLLVVGPQRRPGVGGGTTFGVGGAATYVTVRRDATPAQLARDWVLVHEMIHVAFPSLPSRHHWLEEGLSIYLEPLLRARQGRVTEEEVWRSLLADFPQGLPEAGDPGLDHDDSWARTYYGGAIFWLEADVAIRARTRNAKSVVDALRAIAAAGGNVTTMWPIGRVLELGDRATGTTALSELYERSKDAAEPRELDSLWAKLGVRVEGSALVVDDEAPWADVRRQLVLGRS